jgi:hypothetical protein
MLVRLRTRHSARVRVHVKVRVHVRLRSSVRVRVLVRACVSDNVFYRVNFIPFISD